MAKFAISQHVELFNIPDVGGRFIKGKGFIPDFAPSDLIGTVRGTGQSFITDAKSCQHPTLFKFAANVKPHQRDEIVRSGKAGAVAGLIVEAVAFGKVFWIDWTLLREPATSVYWTQPELICLGLLNVRPDLWRIIPNRSVKQGVIR